MLSNEELTAIKALDLAPEVEDEIILLDEKHREVLFTKGQRTDERQDHPMDGADNGDETDEDINTARGSKRLFKRKDELLPWNVQFS